MSDLAPYALALAALFAGTAAGWAHFRALETIAARLAAGERRVILWQALRLVALGLFLFLCAKGGALTLLAAAGGVFLGRALVMRGARKGAAP